MPELTEYGRALGTIMPVNGRGNGIGKDLVSEDHFGKDPKWSEGIIFLNSVPAGHLPSRIVPSAGLARGGGPRESVSTGCGREEGRCAAAHLSDDRRSPQHNGQITDFGRFPRNACLTSYYYGLLRACNC